MNGSRNAAKRLVISGMNNGFEPTNSLFADVYISYITLDIESPNLWRPENWCKFLQGLFTAEVTQEGTSV